MFQSIADKIKAFLSWHHVKTQLDAREKIPMFQEREVWWCSIGLNVGFEIFGKKELFARPVLILRKYNKYTFLALPLTSKRKDLPSHYHYDFGNRKGSVLLYQTKTLDVRRLSTKISKISGEDLMKLKRAS